MRIFRRKWPAWVAALVIAAGGGIVCVLGHFVIPGRLPANKFSLRVLAPLTLLFAAICYASLLDDKPTYGTRLQLALAGTVGGAACVFVLHASPLAVPISLLMVALGAVIGAVLAVAGVFGLVARGL